MPPIEPADPTDAMEPVDATERMDPLDAIDSIEPTDAIDSIDPNDAVERMLRIERADLIDWIDIGPVSRSAGPGAVGNLEK